jgi:hypothetical protein
MEQIFPDPSALVQRGVLQMEGGVTQLTSTSCQISRFHNAIEDWFRYKDRTFDVLFLLLNASRTSSSHCAPSWEAVILRRWGDPRVRLSKARLSYGLSAAGSISLAVNLGTCGDPSVCSIPQTWLSMINDGVETTNVAGCLAQQKSKVCSLFRALWEFKGSR